MKRVDHPRLMTFDLPRLEALFQDERRFIEFMQCFDLAIEDVMTDSEQRDRPLLHAPLVGYWKMKFHSMRRPPRGARADMRLVYKIDENAQSLYLLGVGARQPDVAGGVYDRMNDRMSP